MKENKILRGLDKLIFFNEKNEFVSESIIPGGSLSVERCLEITRNGALSLLQEIIESIYSQTIEKAKSKYNEEKVSSFIKEYCIKNPSKEYNIMNYGESFSAHLLKLDAAIAEYARFEFLMHQLQFNTIEAPLRKYVFEIDGIKLMTADFYIQHFEIDLENESLLGEGVLLLYVKNGDAHYYQLDEAEYSLFTALDEHDNLTRWFTDSKYSEHEIRELFESLGANQILIPLSVD